MEVLDLKLLAANVIKDAIRGGRLRNGISI